MSKLPKCNTVTLCTFCNHQKAKNFVIRGFSQSSRKSYKESTFFSLPSQWAKNAIIVHIKINIKINKPPGLRPNSPGPLTDNWKVTDDSSVNFHDVFFFIFCYNLAKNEEKKVMEIYG